MSPDLLPAIAAFARVAHHASFTRAAEELGVSPSALSQTVRTLEAKLGVRLLDRSTRSVGATELGRQFLEGARPALAALAQAVEGIDEARDKPAGLLRLNVARVSAELLLYPHFGDFAAAYPDIVLELVCDNRMVDLVEGGFDAGIRLGESLAQDVVALPIAGPQRMVSFAAPRYLEGRTPPRTPEDLREHRCLNFRLTTGGLYRWEYAQDGRELDVEVAGPVIANDSEVLLAAARAGAGIAVAFEARCARTSTAAGWCRCSSVVADLPGLLSLLPEPRADAAQAAGVHRLPAGAACAAARGAQARISASISSAFTGTPREMSSQPVAVTMASSSVRMPMLWNCSGTPSAGRT
jgi:DNA-binding transcriptional LysR family regulator